MRTPLGKTVGSYRALAARWGLTVCTGAPCRRGWTRYAHQMGRVDTFGNLHWSSIDRRLTRAGLRIFLRLVAEARNEWGVRPLWWRLWRSNVEATAIARDELHVKLRAEDSYGDRRYARWLARYVPLRSLYPTAYDWMYYPFRLAQERTHDQLRPDG